MPFDQLAAGGEEGLGPTARRIPSASINRLLPPEAAAAALAALPHHRGLSGSRRLRQAPQPSRMRVLLLAGAAAAAAPCAGASPKPNILHVLLDDFGWADAGWHRPPGYTDLQSPNMNTLVQEGVELERHYVFQFCSPTRSAMQSGRNPIHVNTVNGAPDLRNPAQNDTGWAGIPRSMTGIAEHMLRAGYRTHMYGKWDAGMGTPRHTPRGRGYQSSLVYYHHVNDAWNFVAWSEKSCLGREIIDLWEDSAPAYGLNNSRNCSQANQSGCVYEDQLFADRAMAAIQPDPKPFFVFWAPRVVHSPLEVPQKQLDHFGFIDDGARRVYHAMVWYIDEAIGNVTKRLKASGQWNNTLLVLHADNGGPIYYSGCCGGNNWPLKGGKLSNWEGGIRASAFASGGLLPAKVRGTKQPGLMAGWDWYATYAGLAGVDPTDHRAEAAGLPPIDSHDLWPLLSGQTKASPRTELAVGDVGQVGGLITSDGNGTLHKLLLGDLAQAGWTGPVFPNTSSHWDPNSAKESCGNTSATGCLFAIAEDEGEHANLAQTKADLWGRMMARLLEINATFFAPDRGQKDPAACATAAGKYGGWWGPWVDDVTLDLAP